MSQEMKSSKIPKIINDEIELPEPMIQHIQSFLTRKEAARTTVLSKSWYDAWLTRPTIDFDQRDFNNSEDELPNIRFAEVIKKNMERYEESNLTIDNFKLRLACDVNSSTRKLEILSNKLIMSALERGATELDLHLHSTAFVLPQEVLESEHLARLSLSKRAIDGNVRCWRLKSLILHRVHLTRDDMISDILSCCLLIEELSISFCTRPSSGNSKRRSKMIDLSGMNKFKLHKLRRLFLEKLWLDPSFFNDFGSRFPCLKDLSVFGCFYSWSETIKIASTSLESLSFVKVTTLAAVFHVPNLVSFRYSGEGIPSLSIESSREWESDVSIINFRPVHTHSMSWYLRLKTLLRQLRPSKMSLSISREFSRYGDQSDYREIKAAVSKPLVVENLTIDPTCRLGYIILSGLLSVCRPKFLTVYWLPRNPGYPHNESLVNNLCKRLIEELITPDSCEISDQNLFGQLGLKEASLEVFEENLENEWKPLLLNLNDPLHSLTTQEIKRKLRFQLRWG